MKKALVIITLPIFLISLETPRLEGRITQIPTESCKDATIIHLPCGIDLDTRTPEISLPSELMLAEEQIETGAYLVQFDGPIYPEEREALEQSGATVVAYLPNYTYLVRMNQATRSASTSLRGIRWVGAYEPGYKISSEINLESETRGTFVVLLYAGYPVTSIQERLEELGGRIIDGHASDWETVIEIDLAPSMISSLVHLPEVKWIEPYYEPRFYNSDAQWVIQTWDKTNKTRKIWDKELKGQGQIINIMDSGVRTTHNFFRDPSVPIENFGDFPTHRKIIGYKKTLSFYPTFGDDLIIGHGTHTSGSALGNDNYVGGTSPHDGMAPEAKLFFLDGGSDEYPENVIFGSDLEANVAIAYDGNSAGGARISSHSWGSQTTRAYDSHCVQADRAMWNRPDYLLLSSAGNLDGGQYTGSPGNAKNLVCVGACLNADNANNFASSVSSAGPSGDGRIRPDIITPGVDISSATSANDYGVRVSSGTSMSSPIAAGSVALIRQYFTDGFAGNPHTPSAALLKAMLINSVETDISNFWGMWIPDDKIGWGRPLLDNVLYFDGDDIYLSYIDQDTGLTTGQQYTALLEDVAGGKPLKVTLNWTDYPGANSASPALVNDLHLEVVSPSGKTYLGNNFASENESVEGGTADVLNPTENVFLQSPESGDWEIRVKANNVPSGPQPFAVVVTSDGKIKYQEPEKVKLDIPVLQNPLLSQYIDIWVVPTSGQLTEPPEVSVNLGGSSESVTMNQVSGSEAYRGDYKFTSTGTATISASADDTTYQRSFSVYEISTAGGMIASTDGRFSVEVSKDAVSTQAFFTVVDEKTRTSVSAPYHIKAIEDGLGIGQAYRIGPEGLNLSSEVSLHISYQNAELGSADIENLLIMSYQDGSWIPLVSFIDRETQEVVALTSKLGVFQLAADKRHISPDLFTTIQINPLCTVPLPGQKFLRLYVAAETSFSLTVFDAAGRKAVTLYEGRLPLGRHEFTWQGKDASGRTIAPGIYFIQLKTPTLTETFKIISLH
ncbi:S8 family serine peptidase [candidate division WOR-3 bacterium]|nr:S8 family serine peptidase [candidate division WOR-3 bacterium]